VDRPSWMTQDVFEWHLRHAEVQREQRRALRRFQKEKREARWRARAAAAKAKRHANRSAMACASCGKIFIPARTDAKTCSNKCRQRMHRARRNG
jgi:hypothetical protein